VPRPRPVRVTPAVFHWFAVADLVAVIGIVLTGSAVRLSGSGLGCPDWPTCYNNQLTGPLHGHAIIEYANRAVTLALVVLVGVSFLAAIWRAPRRNDLLVLNGALVLGIVADALLGALVVYSKLNPWLVGLHFLIAVAMVAIAATMLHRCTRRVSDGAPAVVRDRRFLLVARWLWAPFIAVVLTGVLTTGSGPHAGNADGQLAARRLPIAFVDAAWIHSVAATAFVALVCGLGVAVWTAGAPEPIVTGVLRLVVVSVLQAVIGYAQYWLRVPVALVELHVLGVVALTIGVTQLNLRQIAREREPFWRADRSAFPWRHHAPMATARDSP
jgi:heme a synthase